MKLPRIRYTVRRLMVGVAVTAVLVYLWLPLSAADRRMMATYERLGNSDPKPDLTKAEVIRQIGPPSGQDTPPSPNVCTTYTWVATFESPMAYHEYKLNLAIDPKTDLVAGWGLFKTECTGLEAIWSRLWRLTH